MESSQAMADRSGLLVTTLETGKMDGSMAKEQQSIMISTPMWVPSKTTKDMVKANLPKQTAQSMKEFLMKTNSMVTTCDIHK